jgi:hypothetical protein
MPADKKLRFSPGSTIQQRKTTMPGPPVGYDPSVAVVAED